MEIFITLAIKQLKCKTLSDGKNESDNLNISLKLDYLKTVQIWLNLDIASRNTVTLVVMIVIRTGSVVSSFLSFSFN